MNLFDLSGKTAIVTGSSKGIGRGMVKCMAAHGANVVVSSRTAADCEAAATAINEAEGREAALAVACDISARDDLQNLIDATMAKWGRIDTLVCNAMVIVLGTPDIVPEADLQKALATNVWSNYALCRMAQPHMEKTGGGAITFISSIAGVQSFPEIPAYSFSKAALQKMAQDLAADFAKYKIRVNCIAAGTVRSESTEPLWRNEAALKQTEARIALGRIGEPEDIAGCAIFLASKAGAYTTGQNIVVDGGHTLRIPEFEGKTVEEVWLD